MKKHLKFCMVTTFYPPFNFGGDGMHIYRLSNVLAERGHTVDIFHCEDSFLMLNRNPPIGDFPNHPNVRVHGLTSGKGFLSPLLTQQTGVPFLKSELKKALQANDYDVIHFNNMSLIGITALGYGSSSAVKLYTTHEHWLVCPMHVLWKFNREVCTKKACFRCQLVGKRPPQLWRYTGLLEKMLKHVDCFLSPSRFTLNKHLEMGLKIPIKQMPYFLPTPTATTVDGITEKPHDRPYFLFVGRLEEIKGLQNIIPVFQKQEQFDLLVAGDGEYREKLESMAAGDMSIKFLGRVDQKRLAGLYQSARAVIVPSICLETFGIIIIEAFSYKTPVIVNDLGALPEVVAESGGGFVFNTTVELEDAMDKIGSDLSLRNDLGTKGYKAFLKYWNVEAHLTRYLDIIRSLQSSKAAGPKPD